MDYHDPRCRWRTAGTPQCLPSCVSASCKRHQEQLPRVHARHAHVRAHGLTRCRVRCVSRATTSLHSGLAPSPPPLLIPPNPDAPHTPALPLTQLPLPLQHAMVGRSNRAPGACAIHTLSRRQRHAARSNTRSGGRTNAIRSRTNAIRSYRHLPCASRLHATSRDHPFSLKRLAASSPCGVSHPVV